MDRSAAKSAGFTILELVLAMAIFLVVCAAMFGLLQVSQQRYSSESQLSGSFQEARLGIDQIVRDVNVSGYPPVGMFSNPSSAASYALSPFAWDPGYTSNSPCQVGTTCGSPNQFDLIVETDFGNGVSWVRYQLIGTTLYRTVVPKSVGADPVAATSSPSAMTPFVENVMNNVSEPLLGQIKAQYPAMFPTGPVPLFQYTCSTPSGPQPCGNAAAVNHNSPKDISDVDVTLVVKTPYKDMQTQSLRLMELTARGHRSNPAS